MNRADEETLRCPVPIHPLKVCDGDLFVLVAPVAMISDDVADVVKRVDGFALEEIKTQRIHRHHVTDPNKRTKTSLFVRSTCKNASGSI